MPIGICPYRFVFCKACHLLMVFEHKAMWALKELNLKLNDLSNLSVEKFIEMDEF